MYKYERPIPNWGFMMDFPEVQQPNGYYCGPADVIACAAGYYGVGWDEIDEVAREISCTTDGSDPRNFVKYFNKLGLDSEFVSNMTKEELEYWIRRKVPVIICIQAYADDPAAYADPDFNGSGHFVVARGYDFDGYFYFMDSSMTGRIGFLHWAELNQRWHENEGHSPDKPEIFWHEAVIVRPGRHQPVYRERALYIP
jgi:predicted double-glycine peptidase